MVRRVVSVALLPGLLVASLFLTGAGLSAGIRPSLVVMGVVVLAAPIVSFAQRLAPAEASWRPGRKDVSVDLAHFASTAVVTEVFRALSLGAVYELATRWSGRGELWPTHAPWALQFALALLLGEFLAYWMHRLCHRSALLWRFHATHHSSERMYALAAARNHPMNVVLMHACHVVPATALGAPPEVLALCGVFTSVNGLLQHCNVDLRPGVLNWFLATADAHRWHHSAERAESDTNFGNNLIVWDRLFGTCHLPGGRPTRVGLDVGSLPVNFLAHLVSPLVLFRQLRANARP